MSFQQIQNMLMDPNIIINPLFNNDQKKDNFFRKVEFHNEFYIRFFKKLF